MYSYTHTNTLYLHIQKERKSAKELESERARERARESEKERERENERQRERERERERERDLGIWDGRTGSDHDGVEERDGHDEDVEPVVCLVPELVESPLTVREHVDLMCVCVCV